MKKIFALTASALLSLAQPVLASVELPGGATVQADLTLSNQFFQGVAGSDNNHDAFIDYRVETSLPVFRLSEHEGTVVVRVEGLGAIDDKIDDFFDDPLIDIPEIFIRDDYKTESLDYMLVFGKFANRRFFDKQEIYNDPFDIGERRGPAAIEGTLSLLNTMNEFRDSNDSYQSRIASGSYGFVLAVKDREGGGLLDRWGFKQALAVTEMQSFGGSFYGISEVNKNWGQKASQGELWGAGQFDMGFLYSGEQAYGNISPFAPDQTVCLLYASAVQEIGKFVPYIKWGSLWYEDLLVLGNLTGFSANRKHVVNEFRLGFEHHTTSKDTLAMHYAWFDSDNSSFAFDVNNTSVLINSWRHKFNDHIISSLYYIHEFNQPNLFANGFKDNSWTAGLNFNLVL